MSLYGSNFYNLFKYGPDTLVDFDATPFTATGIPAFINDAGTIKYVKESGYSYTPSILLTWDAPSGDWDLLHLVRNNLGFPVTPDDGDLLLETTPSVSQTSYFDTRSSSNPKIVEGKTYYYSIFVRRTSDSKWFNAGVALGTAVKNYGTAELMYNYLPFMYRTPSINGLTTNVSEVNTDLYNFISLYAFEYDKFKTDAENIKARYDISNLNGYLIPAMMNQFGFTYEKEMGLQQGRRLLQNAIAIYSKKGSIAGLKTFVSAFSGYNVTLGIVKNLMLNLNDSSFEKSVGGWDTATNATLSRITGASESPAVTPYLESTSPANYPNATSGLLKVVITAAATASFSCGEDSPKTKGIPVTAGDAYSFTIYSRGKTSARSISINIKWYDSLGVYISSGTAATSTNSTSAWARATKVTATAPSTASFAVPTVSIASGGAGEIHYFDAAQFEAGSSATDYVDARRIDIYLGANRINLVKNPSFESVTTNWASLGGGTLSVVSGGAVTGSSNSVRRTSTGAIVQYGIPVVEGTPYALSGYAKGPAGTTVKPSLYYKDSLGNYVGGMINGSSVTLNSSTWTRTSLLHTPPATAVTVDVYFTYSGLSGAGVYYYLDAVMFEAASYAQDYFDGSTGYYEIGDILWQDGDATNGNSLYYRNRVNVTTRLSTVLPDYVAHGAQWALFAGITPS